MKRIILCLTLITLLSGCGLLGKPYQNNPYIQEIEAALAKQDTVKAMKMTKDAPPELAPVITLWLEDNANRLEPVYLFLLAEHKFAQGKKEEAASWFMAGKIRSLYDAYRCTDSTARSGIAIGPMLALKTAEYINNDQKAGYHAAKRALKWDEMYPPTNSPLWICNHGMMAFSGQVTLEPESKWPEIRNKIRTAIEKGLDKTKASLDKIDKLQQAGAIREIGKARVFSEVFYLSDGRVVTPSQKGYQFISLKDGHLEDEIQAEKGGYGATKILLPDDKLLVIDGEQCLANQRQVRLIDFRTKNTVTGGQLNSCRYAPSATILSDGKVLIVGSHSTIFNKKTKKIEKLGPAATKAELYNPKTKTFAWGGALHLPRFKHEALRLPNDEVVIIGGHKAGMHQPGVTQELRTVEIYNPKTRQFRTAGETILAHEDRHRLTLLKDGKVLITGGMMRNGITSSPAKSAEIYDPKTGQSKIIPNSQISNYHQTALLSDGQVFIAESLGSAGSISFKRFNPATMELATLAELPVSAPSLKMALHSDKQAYLLTGSTIYMLDPSAM